MGEANNQGKYVFGLDIGTRSIVGTVGYRDGDIFHVAAQVIKEHETRAMLDGQIHDIVAVGNTISLVKKELETKLDIKLTDVCIAAAGRVLRTVETSVTWEFEEDRVITPEDIASLTSMAIEKAYEVFQEQNDTDIKFYCVGNSTIRYYMNGYQIGNLESHKAKSIGQDIIATFLPDDVVDGLYKSVEIAGLRVANMTLEPIAAIAVAIPEMYRMLNIALVDVGAGTSDICITKDGCIVAYGMIPVAGDGLTEIVAQNCLVDFVTAESIKRGITENESVEYKDIMGLGQVITRQEVLDMLSDQLESMTSQVSEKIKELNGGKPVSAVFVVGGGGKVAGYTEKMAAQLGIVPQRVALRGEDVMQKINFHEEDSKKDSLLVTPIGICLNFYEQSNNFMYVTFNDERIKLYNNNQLAVVDAAMHANYPNDRLFPRRGHEINYTLNGVKKIVRGGLGEPAVIKVNGEETDIHHTIKANDVILVTDSTVGPDAVLPLSKIAELKSGITVIINGSKVMLPKFPVVNGEIKSMYYDVQDGDKIVLLDYYTIKQVREFMDMDSDDSLQILVNNEVANDNTQVYENFTLKWVLKSSLSDEELKKAVIAEDVVKDNGEKNTAKKRPGRKKKNTEPEKVVDETSEEMPAEVQDEIIEESPAEVQTEESDEPAKKPVVSIAVIANQHAIVLNGKSEYVFVDIFDYIDFDRTKVGGSNLVMTVNGQPANYFQILKEGDVIEVFWEIKN